MKPVIVIPTNREENYFKVFLNNWKSQFEGCTIIVIEDREKCILDLEEFESLEIVQYCWKDIDKSLKENSWIIPRRTDCVRSFGYYAAYKYFNPLFIITLDDDISPFSGNLFSMGSTYNYD